MDNNITWEEFFKLIKSSDDYTRIKMFKDEVLVNFDNDILNNLGIISYEESRSPFMHNKPLLYVTDKFFETNICNTIDTYINTVYLKELSTNTIILNKPFNPLKNSFRVVEVSHNLKVKDIYINNSDIMLVGAKDSFIHYENMYLNNISVIGYIIQYNTKLHIENLFYFVEMDSSLVINQIEYLLNYLKSKDRVSYDNIYILANVNSYVARHNIKSWIRTLLDFDIKLILVMDDRGLNTYRKNFSYGVPVYLDEHIKNNFLDVLNLECADV